MRQSLKRVFFIFYILYFIFIFLERSDSQKERDITSKISLSLTTYGDKDHISTINSSLDGRLALLGSFL